MSNLQATGAKLPAGPAADPGAPGPALGRGTVGFVAETGWKSVDLFLAVNFCDEELNHFNIEVMKSKHIENIYIYR